VGKELSKLAVKLGRQGLVMGHHQGWSLYLFYNLSNRKGLAGTGRAQQGLVPQTGLHSFDQLLDGLRLIASWFIV
jgi:hypothetical protein